MRSYTDYKDHINEEYERGFAAGYRIALEEAFEPTSFVSNDTFAKLRRKEKKLNLSKFRFRKSEDEVVDFVISNLKDRSNRGNYNPPETNNPFIPDMGTYKNKAIKVYGNYATYILPLRFEQSMIDFTCWATIDSFKVDSRNKDSFNKEDKEDDIAWLQWIFAQFPIELPDRVLL